ncbi:hypothetical protein A6E01_20225 (plasmid) [Vibrio breoganii]|uniref:Uncharacterized protein n=2 Tax=Vibrio breoganii TaxID=553239 RepID=A0AAN1CUA5_9VIBR|nr:hypothetical protein [Vibrio breoganii]ANO35541.1 hypothetical protein A6E01_20225 [Vibrio breoganii]
MNKPAVEAGTFQIKTTADGKATLIKGNISDVYSHHDGQIINAYKVVKDPKPIYGDTRVTKFEYTFFNTATPRRKLLYITYMKTPEVSDDFYYYGFGGLRYTLTED